MRHKKLASVTALVLVSAIGVGYFNLEQTPPKRVMSRTQVETQPVTTKNLTDQVSGYGTIESSDYVVLKSLQTNKITAIKFSGGETVTSGQTLLVQDSRTASAQVEQDQAQLTQAKNEWQRQANLMKKGLVSQSDYDDAYSAYKQAVALLAQDTALLSELTIKAPFSGVISTTDFHVGDVLDSGSNIATLYNPNQLTVTYQLPSSQRSHYSVGQTVMVQSEMELASQASGKVTYISPNLSSGLITLKADLATGAMFTPGQNVKVVQQTQQMNNQVVIPTASLLTSLEGAQAYVVEEGKAVMRDVTVGNYYDGYVQILSGLKTGDQLVTNGQNFLHSDEPVEVNNSANRANGAKDSQHVQASGHKGAPSKQGKRPQEAQG
ncbi:efflux RND transporter periplasmic adaptor subunit [Vibrio profundum]|uniref:efflux RND transporter periplasmic adaptor subunit n=1 Tax=Vibrio profundum TaxID=2910247 RepID=UPI003D0D4373